MRAATAEASNVIQKACSTATQGAMDFSAKAIEFAHANSKTASENASELLGVKSSSQFLEVSTEQARKQFEVLYNHLLRRVFRPCPVRTALARVHHGGA